MEKVTINFNEKDLEGDYVELIIESVKNHLFKNRDIQYIFPQIQNGGTSLKNKISEELNKLNIENDYNVGFVSTKTNEAIFKIIICK